MKLLSEKNLESALGIWLCRITVNECLMYLRGQKRYVFVSDACPEESLLSDSGFRPLSPLEERLRMDLGRAISRLDVKGKTVFVLREIEGRTNQEIADMLGITLTAAKSRLHRSKLKLRKANNLRQYICA